MTDNQAPRPPRRSIIRRAFAWTDVSLRWFVLAGWIAATVASVLFLPTLSSAANSGGLSDFLPKPSAALRIEARSLHEFRLPLLARTVIVQRNPNGLPLKVQVDTVAAAARFDRASTSPLPGLRAAVPVLNTDHVIPFARESSTTALTFLAFRPGLSLSQQQGLAERYAARYLRPLPEHGSVVGVTGLTAGRYHQQETLLGELHLVELVAVLAVLVIIALQFRSLIAPLVLLACAVVAYLLTVHVAAWLGEHYQVTVPTELEPLIVVLLLGVVTDYSVFFLTGTRDQLAAGDERVPAVRHAVATNAPWVLGAGLAVAAGTAVLLVARLDIFRALGPGMALTVIIGLVVSLTLTPALLAIIGRPAFWPGLRAAAPASGATDERTEPADSRRIRRGSLRALTVRPVAALLVLVVVVGLGIAGWQLTHARLGISIVTGLPADSVPRRAEAAAAAGFAPGITDPTVIVVHGAGVAAKKTALGRLQRELKGEPGVAGVLGPGNQPTGRRLGLFLAHQGDAARYLVVLDSPPLEATAIGHINALEARLPALLRQAGLGADSAGVTGDTAIAGEVVSATTGDIVRVGIAALVVDLIVLLLFLRAPLASLVLLVIDAVALAGALGLSLLVLQRLLHLPQYTFYVPLAVGVLLLAFGSDYNLFLVGRIWDAAAGRTMREAAIHAGPPASRAVAIAGVTLAASFATLALVPLVPFREFAIAMVIGVMLDVIIVRPLLVPALLALMGGAGSWPRRRGVPGGRRISAG